MTDTEAALIAQEMDDTARRLEATQELNRACEGSYADDKYTNRSLMKQIGW